MPSELINWRRIIPPQDKKDDVTAGVKSTALLFGHRTKPILSAFAAANVALLAAAGSAVGAGWPYYAAVAAGGCHLAWQLAAVDLDNGRDCMEKFVSNKAYGAVLFAGIVADRLLAAPPLL